MAQYRDDRMTLRLLPLLTARARRTVPCLVACVALMVACAPSTAAKRAAAPTRPVPTPTATQHVLPRYTDWRAAYMGMDGNLHVVSLDGNREVMVGPLGGMTTNGLHLTTAGISPDGSLLAYVGDDGMQVVAVGSGDLQRRASGIEAEYIIWSPDGNQIALSNGGDGFSVQRISDGHLSIMPGSGSPTLQGMGEIVGWTAPTLVAVSLNPTTPTAGDFANTTGVGVVDITNWQVRTVATISAPNLDIPYFALSPDGTEALLYNRQFRADPFTPLTDLIDMRTGAVTPLPRIAAQVLSKGFGFTTVAWKPGTQTVMVSNGFGNGGLWLLNLGNDTALAQPADPQTGAMYPVGWAPDGSHVVLSSGWQAGVNEGPFTLVAATVGAQGITATTVLTTNAMNFPFLGFARNP